MTLNTRVKLTGDKPSRIRQAMEYAGWYPNRSVDATEIEQSYKTTGLPFFSAGLHFFREFSRIAGRWYSEHHKPLKMDTLEVLAEHSYPAADLLWTAVSLGEDTTVEAVLPEVI